VNIIVCVKCKVGCYTSGTQLRYAPLVEKVNFYYCVKIFMSVFCVYVL
jgi:hypothetical protein